MGIFRPILWFFCISPLIANEVVYISLGRSCQPAFFLRDLQLRNESYPFDWLISHYESVYDALADDFSRFFAHLSLNPDKTAAVDYYGLEFRNVWRHEGHRYNQVLDLINWQEQVPLVTENFARKINRFREACNSNKKVIFVRWEDINFEQAVQLRDLIKSKYPNLSFILMVIKECPEFESPWREENIRNFSFPFNDGEAWKRTLAEANS